MTFLFMKLVLIGTLLLGLPEKQLSITDLENFKKSFIETEAAFAKAHCFCRIGNDRGYRQDEFPNAIKDFGKIKRYTGLRPQKKKNQDDCSRRCALQAEAFLSSLSPDQLCKLFRKTGTVRALAYSKVGTKSWTVSGASKSAQCCTSGGETICNSGWGPEPNNFPGYCSKAICPPLVKGDRRLYNDNGTVWGFIWKDMMYQLKKGKTTPIVFQSCN